MINTKAPAVTGVKLFFQIVSPQARAQLENLAQAGSSIEWAIGDWVHAWTQALKTGDYSAVESENPYVTEAAARFGVLPLTAEDVYAGVAEMLGNWRSARTIRHWAMAAGWFPVEKRAEFAPLNMSHFVQCHSLSPQAPEKALEEAMWFFTRYSSPPSLEWLVGRWGQIRANELLETVPESEETPQSEYGSRPYESICFQPGVVVDPLEIVQAASVSEPSPIFRVMQSIFSRLPQAVAGFTGEKASRLQALLEEIEELLD